MSCAAIQRYLLRVERPERPPAVVRQHLERCGRCRQWQRRLIQLERNVSRLPVPASQAKGKVLQALRRKGTRARRKGSRPLARKAFAVAAAVVLVVFGWWALRGWQN